MHYEVTLEGAENDSEARNKKDRYDRLLHLLLEATLAFQVKQRLIF